MFETDRFVITGDRSIQVVQLLKCITSVQMGLCIVMFETDRFVITGNCRVKLTELL